MKTESPPRGIVRKAKWYWGVCAFVGLALTILVNGAHAKQVMPDPNTWTAVTVAVIPPVMFAALFEGYFLARRAVSVNVLRMVKVSIVVLGGASFAISYTTIAYFIQRRHGDLPVWTAWVMPGLLDLFIAVSAYVVYVLSKHGTDTVEAAPKVKTSSRLRRIADAATNRFEAALDVPEKPQVNELVEVRGGSVEPSLNLIETSVEPSPNSPVEVAEPFTEPFVESSEEVTAPSPKPSVKSSSKSSPIVLVDESLAPFMDAAQDMVSRRVVARKTMVELAQVIREIEAGKSNNAVKQSLGVSPSTTEAVRAAWAEWRREHRLVAV